MGIQDLSVLLKEKCENSLSRVALVKYRGRKIAVDFMNLAFIYYKAAYAGIIRKKIDEHIEGPSEESLKEIESDWFILFKGFILKLINVEIIPIFVLDGKSKDAKSETLQKRKDTIKRDKDRLEDLLSKEDALDTNDSKKLSSLRSREGNIPKDGIEKLLLFIRSCGFPIVTARGEGERLCSMLVRDKIAVAVYSNDTDTLACGATCVIKSIDSGTYKSFNLKKDEHRTRRGFLCNIYNLPGILKDLELNQEKFRWLCILMGCDFNKRVKGVGPKTAYKRIKNSDTWEEAVDGLDSECLKFGICEELFKPVPYQELIEDGYLEMDKDNINREIIDFLGHGEWFSGAITAILKICSCPDPVSN